MAIDTTNKKLSLMTLGEPWLDPLPISSDGLGQADKQHLLALYCGTLATVLDADTIDFETALARTSLIAHLSGTSLTTELAGT